MIIVCIKCKKGIITTTPKYKAFLSYARRFPIICSGRELHIWKKEEVTFGE